MKIRSLFAMAIVALLMSLTACSGDDDGNNDADDKAGPAIVEASQDRGSKVLECRDGLMTVDVPLGSHRELDGSGYKLVAKTKPLSYGDVEQVSVRLTVKLNKQTALPALVVHAIEGDETGNRPGKPYNDKSLDVKMGAGSQGNFTFPTVAYGQYPILGDLITGVTLCLDVSTSNPES